MCSDPQTPEDMASSGDLEPTHYPARRAATVALHQLNTRHGSPHRLFALQEVHKASAEVRLKPVCTDSELDRSCETSVC